ncbi:hypothetical protein BVC80_8877g3 [Macleaya cordata]|uniref:Retrotransposon gag domain-containing protein n=1 Tax=Macleaya cordata TaxID=56857 RepID=A0A200QA94_MACCD|nr:hypothetical protein BVC80_8877g3 [Macleaya cordata]
MVGNLGPHDDNAILKDFKSWEPTSYDGTPDPAKAEKYLKDIEKIFDLIRCTDELKVRMATYMLVDDAWDWWKSTLEGMEFYSFNEIVRKVQMLERGCEVLQRRQEMAIQKREATQFPQRYRGTKRFKDQGESSQGSGQQQPQRASPQNRTPQQPANPQGNNYQNKQPPQQ